MSEPWHQVALRDNALFALTCSAIANIDPEIFGLNVHGADDDEFPRVFKSRRKRRRTFRASSTWSHFLLFGDFSDPNSPDSEKFRRLNRVPHSMFQKLVNLADQWFPQRHDALGKLGVANNLLVSFFLNKHHDHFMRQYTNLAISRYWARCAILPLASPSNISQRFQAFLPHFTKTSSPNS